MSAKKTNHMPNKHAEQPSHSRATPIDEIDSIEESDELNEEYTVEKIVGKRTNKGEVEYCIKWEGYSNDENTWEPMRNLNCIKLIEQYEEDLTKRTRTRVRTSQSPTKRRTRQSITPKDYRESTSTPDTDALTVEEPVDERKPVKSRRLLDRNSTSPNNSNLFSDAESNLDTIMGFITDDKDKLFAMVRWKNRPETIKMISVAELEEKAPRELCAWYRERLYHNVNVKDVLDLFAPVNDK